MSFRTLKLGCQLGKNGRAVHCGLRRATHALWTSSTAADLQHVQNACHIILDGSPSCAVPDYLLHIGAQSHVASATLMHSCGTPSAGKVCNCLPDVLANEATG